jgi:hypothetical protein
VISYDEFTNYLKEHFLDPCRSTLGVSANDIEELVKAESEQT